MICFLYQIFPYKVLKLKTSYQENVCDWLRIKVQGLGGLKAADSPTTDVRFITWQGPLRNWCWRWRRRVQSGLWQKPWRKAVNNKPQSLHFLTDTVCCLSSWWDPKREQMPWEKTAWGMRYDALLANDGHNPRSSIRDHHTIFSDYGCLSGSCPVVLQ